MSMEVTMTEVEKVMMGSETVFVVDLWRELYTRSIEIHTNVVIKILLFKVSSIDQ